MKLRACAAPFLYREKTVFSMQGDALFALLALLVLPCVQYGPRVLLAALAACASCAVCDIVTSLLVKRSFGSGDLSSLVTGLTVAMLLPPTVPYWLPALAGAFAILAVKLPFGATGNNLFNPAAAGVAFATVCRPDLVFAYADPAAGWLSLESEISFTAGTSPGSILAKGLMPSILPRDLLWGVFPGAIGCTGALVLGAAAIFLLVRRSLRWETMVCFLVTAAVAAALFPRIPTTALTSVKYELLTGSLLFAAVFLCGDPVTTPRTFTGRCCFGALAAALLMAMRHVGAYEQGACFAILLANAFSPVLDGAVLSARMKGVRLP